MTGTRRLAAPLSGVALALLTDAAFLPAGAVRHSLILVGSGLLGASLGMPLLRGTSGDLRWLSRPAAWPLAVAGGAVAIGGLIMWCGMRQFGGFDHSALIDLAWRLASGQKPYRDFPCPAPISFVLGAGYAFQIFGVQWRSLVLIDAVFAMVAFAVLCALLTRLLAERWRAWLFAFSTQATTTVLAAFWWYNPVTTVTGLVFFLAAACWLRAPRDWFPQTTYAVSLFVLAGMKPNIAGVLIAGTTVVLLSSAAHRWRALGWSSAACAAFVLWLAAHGLRVPDMIASYLGIASRGFSLHQFLQDMSVAERIFSLAVLAVLLATAFVALRPTAADDTRLRALAVIAAAAGLHGFVTNGETKLVDLTLVWLAVWVFASSRPLAANTLSFLAVFLVGCGLGMAITRHRVKAIGEGVFFEYRTVGVAPPTTFFDGMVTGPRFVRVARDVASVLARNPGASVWFGPRMQWAYAAFRRPSPVGQPSWWHPGVAFAVADEPAYRQDWFAHDFETVIFLSGDTTYLAPEFLTAISQRYAPVPAPPSLTVLHLRSQP